jgi:hypothetical protein
MIHIVKVVADAEARNSRKTYLVGRGAAGTDAIYVFASHHPDARSAAINVMLEYTPAGEYIRRPGLRRPAGTDPWALLQLPLPNATVPTQSRSAPSFRSGSPTPALRYGRGLFFRISTVPAGRGALPAITRARSGIFGVAAGCGLAQ